MNIQKSYIIRKRIATYLKQLIHSTPLLTLEGQGVSLLGLLLLTGLLVSSCARMGNPDGGWYDETPPKVIGATPADKGVDVKSKKVHIYFNEYVKLENASEKVVVSPPQLEQAEIKTQGKSILVELKDSLRSNTTYTVDFSDAISDNNEGNPLGNYTYSFSTGSAIDTLEVAGTVLNAENLEPIKGILVGLYKLDPDSAKLDVPFDTIRYPLAKYNWMFRKQPFLRVSRTDSQGKFIIRGIAPGEYRCCALQDVDANYMYSQKSEQIAFDQNLLIPSCAPDTRQDTIWTDTLHIKDIKQVKYTHFFPDNIVLRAFTYAKQDRYFLKGERLEPNHITCYFTGPGTKVPTLRLFNEADRLLYGESPFIVEAKEKLDTITYWIKDTALVNRDTLDVEFTYEMNDTLGNIVMQTDTTQFLSKVSYAKRMKELKKKQEEWDKQIAKKKKKGEEITDSIMPGPCLEPRYSVNQSIAPDAILRIDFPTPLAKFDSAAIHIYAMRDSIWYRAPFELRHSPEPNANDRNWEILADWLPGTEYSFEVDTLAFEDIYGLTSKPFKTGFKVQSLDEFATLFVNISGAPKLEPLITDTISGGEKQGEPAIIVQLLNQSDKPIKETVVANDEASFYYLKPDTYYLRAIIDQNGNGKWDSGDFDQNIQPEEVYYSKDPIECKAKWDAKRDWNLTSMPLDKQKPGKLTKQKADKKKTVKQRNAELARQKGVAPPAVTD